ncbi:nad-aldehyde dehydrogenase [Phaffia rhodozyma]|uniref:Nad-aldehyde dehydrogenase n=1 Tax=Phaffia rhodozyma TaxID=264483 RepID=A0A0F7SIW8_PHARH|nr:nad-aldehyde dehydrogenase [Phaffia rhodozyma]
MPAQCFENITLPSGKQIDVPTGLFINNEWSPSSDGKTFETVDPATGEKLLDFAHATSADVDRAVVHARKAFKTTWGKNVAATERAALLYKFADLIEQNSEVLAELESWNSGKGVRIAREADVGDSVACIRYYAGLADKSHGQTIDTFGKDKIVYTLHEPIGVCGQIIPWNYPMLMWAWKVGPALAAGCCVIMKPSELTPLTALFLCTLTIEAGFPAGVIQTLAGLGATTGHAISSHMNIDKIAFTGSVITGRRIAVAAAESNLKKVTLELGGKSPSLVFNSADIEDAANWLALGIWFNSGQDCCAGSRLYVQSGIYDQVVAKLVEKAKACAIGKPSDEATSFGPLISAGQRDKVINYIEKAKADGAKVATGGQKWAQSTGFYVEPTVLTEVTEDMQCVREEIFGPVIVVAKFETEEEGLELANNTSYGLAAAVFTSDAKQSMRVSGALEAGTIWVNSYALLHVQAPFGGYKQSGIGRELGTYGLEAYQQIKSVHHNIDGTMSWPV